MEIRNQLLIDEFADEHPDAASNLERWEHLINACKLSNFAELKRTFASASSAAPYTVFDICGSSYRLISIIHHAIQVLIIEAILTHSNYGRWNAKRRKRGKR